MVPDLLDRAQPVIATQILRTIPSDARPFQIAVCAIRRPSSRGRATAIWERFVGCMYNSVTASWSSGKSVDLFDGDIYLVASASEPYVTIVSDAPYSAPNPMHLRGVVHLIENARASMRREAAISPFELDRIAACGLQAAVKQYPVGGRQPGESAALERLLNRFGSLAHEFELAG